ncbi:PilZ domain-containing protein [Mariprofundus ferrooxydans]|uniref:PilZ domain-containing protein n=1 Tax=Mariprofundus ferrooxydans TaxID=314344 RepID=UPI0003676AB6|nr:PilZ domain-containing protein [Mariprofundus ferrooxydans]
MGFLDKLESLPGRLINYLLPNIRRDEEKIVISHGGDTDELYSGTDRRKHVRFPVNLAVQHGSQIPLQYQDFILNAGEGGVFIQCDTPLPTGTPLILHFYIPPEEMLLAEFKGEVINISRCAKYGNGMHVKFTHYHKEDMEHFLSYLEEKRHLLDVKA